MNVQKSIENLVLDATPLITQSASALQQYASSFYTTPGVRAELRDEHARNQLILWGDSLKVRQPKQEMIDRVSNFAKLTGDFSVLSMNDIHVIALAYELEYEINGDSALRKTPGEVLKIDGEEPKPQPRKFERRKNTFEEPEPATPSTDDDGFQVVASKKKSKKRFHKPRPEPKEEPVQSPPELIVEEPQVPPKIEASETEHNDASLEEEFNELDDDGDWITPANLQQTILKDNNESVQDVRDDSKIAVALSTGDFACQNVSMQIGLRLLNYVSGKQIKRVRNYMYRCHACFTMTPMPKSGERKHFCSKCGGDTLLRCAVSIDDVSGKVTPHLKRNFQWITKGQVYSVASPLSKNTKKQQGRAGYQHNKENRHKNLQDPLILREDQKEYAQAMKDDAWNRKKSEKMLQEWIGGGSADNYISPFGTTHRSSGVKVGRGRNANAVKGRKK